MVSRGCGDWGYGYAGQSLTSLVAAREAADIEARRWRLVAGGVRTQWSPLPGGLNDDARMLTEELRAMKDGTGLSLALLAARTHYSRSSWERWLNGKRLITAQALLAFAEAAEIADGTASRLLALLGKAAVRQPSPAAARPAGRPPLPHGPAIAQLPAAIRYFAGREDQVAALRAALTARSSGPGQVGV